METKGWVELLDTNICKNCRFCEMVQVKDQETVELSILCKRKDCDNWVHGTLQDTDAQILDRPIQ